MGMDGFRKAFAEARKNKKKKFSHKGKEYSTETAEESAKKMSKSELSDKFDKADKEAYGSKSKSKKEIATSLQNEIQYRMHEEMKKTGKKNAFAKPRPK